MAHLLDVPPPIPAEVEELLWVERMTIAECWGLESAPEADVMAAEQAATPALARWMSAVDDREQVLFEWEHAARELARVQGEQVRLLARALDLALENGAARRDATMSVRSLAAELACAVAMSDRTIEQHMSDAAVIRDRFTAAFAMLREGTLSRAHVQVIADEGLRIGDDAQRAEYERVALEVAPYLTTGRLRAAAKAIAETLMPTTIAERHDEARSRRKVVVRDADDGMAEVYAYLPAALAHGLHDRLTQLARTVQDAARDASQEDDRTMDQLRADILCDLALTGQATAAEIDAHGGEGIDRMRAIVQITIPAATLTGTGDEAPYLAGRCPIDPDTARRLAGNATIWDRVFTDPLTGDILAVDRRFASEAQRRYLRPRDEHCRFPGCRQPVWRCDVDHTVDHQHGGATEPCNLAHLCRRHHMLKHNTAWTVEQVECGVLVWTSPLGRVYTDRPPPTVRFVPTRC